MALLSHNNPLNPLHLPFSSKPSRPVLPVCAFTISKAPIPSLHVTATPPASPASFTSNPDNIIRSLCLHGKLEEAINLFDSSPTHKFEEETYIALIKLCRRKHAVSEGYRVHTRISETDTLIGLSIGTALVQMHVKFQKFLNAWTVFAKMPERSVYVWNVMINGYGQSGFLDESLDLYQRMIWGGFKPDVYTFTCVSRCCGGLKDLITGKEIHAHVFRFNFGSELDISNALITMYSKCGDLTSARKVFDKIPKKSHISWNAMIAGYIENHKNTLGVELFLSMLSLSLEPKLFAMTSIISQSNSKLGESLHGYAIKKGFALDSTISSSLIRMYSRSNQMENADKIFSRMDEKSKTLISWTSMISGYEQNGSSIKALELYSQLEPNNFIPDHITIVSALAACANSKNLEIGTKLHKLAKSQGVETNNCISNVLLEMYSKNRCIEQAMEVFKKAPDKDVISFTTLIWGFNINNRNLDSLRFFKEMQKYVEPNEVTYMAVLSACADLGAVNCGKEIHAMVLKIGFLKYPDLSNSIMDLYAKCGKIKYAISQFNFVNGKFDVVSWNILIDGHGILGQADKAEQIFNSMVEIDRLNPDDVTFTNLLSAFSKSRMVRKGKNYFYKMVHEYSIIPNLRHYACMVDLLGRAGHLNEAMDFIEDLINNRNIKPDHAIWGALLNACIIHDNLELGEFASKFLLELEPDNEGYHLLVCKFYSNFGLWERVDRVRESMREKGLESNPGCSWVEVKGVLHAFLTNDKSHPQLDEIDGVLRGLRERIVRVYKADPFVDPVEKEEEKKKKEDALCGHSERMAIGFGLISSLPGVPVSVTKNLYMCDTCHEFVKLVSGVVRREISVRDTEKFHRFKEGQCSCGN